MQQPIIEIAGLSKRYSALDHEILAQIDLTIQKGEFVVIIGKSGSGKTTLLNIIGGLDHKYNGAVILLGQNIKELSDAKLSHLRNRSIGFVFQSFNLLPHLNCFDNVMLPFYFARKSPIDKVARVKKVLDQVGLSEKFFEYPAKLSGGQKQRVAIARALVNNPELILCDEPTGNLDTVTGKEIIELFSSLNRQQNITFVVVTHEDTVSQAANRVITIAGGKLVK